MFSKTCEYAIRAVIYLARNAEHSKKAGIKEIATAIGAPEFFTGKILLLLSRKTLIRSVKGPGGGFYMDELQLNKNLADIVEAVDGDQLFKGCGLGLKECSEITPCPVHHQFKNIRNDIYRMLKNARLSGFQNHTSQVLTFLK